MKLYLIFLLGCFAVWDVMCHVKDCNIPCDYSSKNWICKPDGDGCYFEFMNDCHMITENCLRGQKGLANLEAGTYTKCLETQTPICSNLSDKLKESMQDDITEKED